LYVVTQRLPQTPISILVSINCAKIIKVHPMEACSLTLQGS